MRYPIIYQTDFSDCGPACLAMIARYYHRHVSVARLRDLSGTTGSGTLMAGLHSAAEQIGFEPTAVRATSEALPDIQTPAVVQVGHHFIVLYKLTHHEVVIGDPTFGLRTIPRDQFLKDWTGIVLLLRPTPRLDKLPGVQSAFSRMVSFLLPHNRLILGALSVAVPTTVLGFSTSYFIQELLDDVLVQRQTPALNQLALGMLLLTLARVSFHGVRSYLFAHLRRELEADAMAGYHRDLLGLPLSFYISRRTGDILGRLHVAAQARAATGSAALSILADGILVTITLAVMLWLNWPLTLVSLVLLPVLAAGAWYFTRGAWRYQLSAMQSSVETHAQALEGLSAIQDVKSLQMEERLQDRIDNHCRYCISLTSMTSNSHLRTLSAGFTALSAFGVLWFGAHQVLDGTVTLGQWMAFFTLALMALSGIEQIANAAPSIQDTATEHVLAKIDCEPETIKESETAVYRLLDGGIQFEHVRFAYGSGGKVFEDLNVRIEPGESIRLAGEPGCGKTTFTRLISRLLDPTAGRILLDGVDVRDYTFECLRSQIACVPQDPVLLGGTIEDNIRHGRPDRTYQDMLDAAKQAGITDGYKKQVGERGSALSHTERQRVALARALAVKPVILILDDLSIDVQHIIDDRHRRGALTIVISQRPLNVDRTINL